MVTPMLAILAIFLLGVDAHYESKHARTPKWILALEGIVIIALAGSALADILIKLTT